MENLILILVLLAIVVAAGIYIYKAKKSGKKCIGCPNSASCGSRNCSCCTSKEE